MTFNPFSNDKSGEGVGVALYKIRSLQNRVDYLHQLAWTLRAAIQALHSNECHNELIQISNKAFSLENILEDFDEKLDLWAENINL